MVLPAVIKNGERELKVNVILDPCSTGSYVTEAAAEELQRLEQYNWRHASFQLGRIERQVAPFGFSFL